MKGFLFALFAGLFMVGCGDPGEEIINVTLYNRGETTQLTVRVNDLEWHKQDGHWIGTPKNERYPEHKPTDKDALKAIEDYVKKYGGKYGRPIGEEEADSMW